MVSESGRREEILASATQLFAAKGVQSTSVRDIAEAVGMLSGSLYHHFASKDAIVDAVLEEFLTDLRIGCRSVLERESDPREQLRDLIQVSFDVAMRHPHATAIYQNDGAQLTRQERFGYIGQASAEVRESWLAVIRGGVQQGVFRRDLDAVVVYRLARDAVWSSTRWFTPSAGYPGSRFTKDCAAVFLEGCAVGPARKASSDAST